MQKAPDYYGRLKALAVIGLLGIVLASVSFTSFGPPGKGKVNLTEKALSCLETKLKADLAWAEKTKNGEFLAMANGSEQRFNQIVSYHLNKGVSEQMICLCGLRLEHLEAFARRSLVDSLKRELPDLLYKRIVNDMDALDRLGGTEKVRQIADQSVSNFFGGIMDSDEKNIRGFWDKREKIEQVQDSIRRDLGL